MLTKTTKSLRLFLAAVVTVAGAVTAFPQTAAAGSCSAKTTSPAPAGFISVKDYGAVGNGKTNDTGAIECTITAAATRRLGVWFPSGRYEVNRTIPLPAGTSLRGEAGQTTPAIIQGTTSGVVIGDTGYRSGTGSYAIADLFFDSVQVQLWGQWTVDIQRSAFSDSRGVLSTQLGLVDVHGATVNESIFLHGAQSNGSVAISTYKSRDVTITRNIEGLDLSKLAWLPTWPGHASWANSGVTPTAKLTKAATLLGLTADQGHLRSALYANQATNITYDSNIVLGSLATAGVRDHIAYFWGQGSGRYTRNYVRGWPADASGGVKVRNGSTVLVGANDITGSGILLYVYDNVVPYTLDNVTLCRNRVTVLNGTPNNDYTGIFYWETIDPTSLSNIAMFDNTFLDPSHTAYVSITNGDPAAFDVFSSNRWADTGATVPVRYDTVDSGTPDAAHQAQCSGLTVPVYAIP